MKQENAFDVKKLKLISQYEFVKVIKDSNDVKDYKEIAKLRRGNTKQNTGLVRN